MSRFIIFFIRLRRRPWASPWMNAQKATAWFRPEPWADNRGVLSRRSS